jgi:hypothetical protein
VPPPQSIIPHLHHFSFPQQNSHGSYPYEDHEDFLQHLEDSLFPKDRILTYQSDRSYIEDGSFIKIINKGTPQFATVKECVDRIDFFQILVNGEEGDPNGITNRGNKQVSQGYWRDPICLPLW